MATRLKFWFLTIAVGLAVACLPLAALDLTDTPYLFTPLEEWLMLATVLLPGAAGAWCSQDWKEQPWKAVLHMLAGYVLGVSGIFAAFLLTGSTAHWLSYLVTSFFIGAVAAVMAFSLAYGGYRSWVSSKASIASR